MTYSNDPRNIFVDQRSQNTSNQSQNNNQNTYQNKNSQSNNSNQSYQGNQNRQNTTNSQNYQDAMNSNNPELNKRIAEMKELAKKYQREGESQLVKDIINNVIEQKARGYLTNEQLQQFAKRIVPLLNNEQRQRLSGLLEQLMRL